MDRGFSSFHPAVCFSYFALIIVFSLLLFNPVCLLLSLGAAIAYLLLCGRGKAHIKMWGFYFFIGIVVLLVNPIFNHRGINILFYIRDNPVTLEAVVYGGTMALSLLTVLFAFMGYQQAVDDHKFMYIFSAFLPKTALLLMMSMRFVPLLIMRTRQISAVQKTRGLDMGSGPVGKRVKDGMQMLHILITWSLEEALQTADSMKARGYGVARRSSYARYKMGKRDWALLAAVTFLAAVTTAGWYLGYGRLEIYPELGGLSFDGANLVFYAAFCLLCLLPVYEEGKDILVWRQSK